MTIESKQRSILRGLAMFGAAWQVLWLLSEADLVTVLRAEPVSAPVLALAVSAVAWIGVWPSLFGPLRSARRVFALQVVIVGSVFVAGAALVADSSAIGADGWFVGASVINLAAGLAGIYLPRRAGVSTVAGIVLIEAVLVVTGHWRGFDEYPLSIDLVYPLYALALGLASAASRDALLTAARAQDVSSRELSRQQSARVDTESADASMTLAQTRLHETVLNTLTAIVRGGLGEDSATRSRIQDRAAESADVLESIAQGADFSMRWAGDLGADLASVISDLHDAGVRVRLEGVLAPVEEATGAYRAMGSAMREALINVYRHASATTVTIDADVVKWAGSFRWRVRIEDDGVGFASAPPGYGLRSVISEGLASVGGRAIIDSAPGRGTRLELEVPMADARQRTAAIDGPLRAIGAPVLTAFTAFSLFVIGATWGFAQVPAANLAAVAVFAVLVLVLAIAIFPILPLPRQRPAVAPWWVVVVVALGVPIMTRIETFAEAIANPTGDWSSEAAAALLFIVVAAGPWWAVPVALLSWFAAQGDVLVELTRPGTIVIVVAGILGWSIRRADARIRQMRFDSATERSAIAASQQRLLEVRRRYADVDTRGLVDLLRAIASGDLDPNDAGVREACVRQERLIRSVLRLHPERNLVHRDLVRLAVIAQERNVDLSIDAAQEVPPDAGLRDLASAITLLERARNGSIARASTSVHSGVCVFRLVASIDSDRTADLPDSLEILDDDPSEGCCVVVYEESCIIGVDGPRSAGEHRTTAVVEA